MKLGLIGEKLSHSHSQAIHDEIMKRNGISGTYELFEVAQNDLENKLKELRDGGYNGVTITLPYKEKVVDFVDEIDDKARYIGAVNTISFKDGIIKGYNTDYDGFRALLDYNDICVKKKDIIILGSGGTARTVAKALVDSQIFDLTIVTRSRKEFHSIYSTSFDFIAENPTNCDILINCTPVGMYPNMNETPIDADLISTPLFIDLIYNPKKTKLMEKYEKKNTNVIGGYYMLIKQALAAHNIWSL